MKKIAALVLVLLLGLTACARAPAAAEPTELMVFAAASMQETMTEIVQLYQSVAPDVAVTCTFDSSGTLKTQIEQGAVCDLFLSAGRAQMDALDADGESLLLAGSRTDLLENKVVLAVPSGNPAGVASFDAVTTDAVALLAVGNADVPVGQYAEEILTAMGVWDALQGKLTFASNAKEVTAWIGEGAVDCGVVYGTDARAAQLEVVASAPKSMLKAPVVYPAAVLGSTEHEAVAVAFLDYLRSDACAAVFEAAGFSIPD